MESDIPHIVNGISNAKQFSEFESHWAYYTYLQHLLDTVQKQSDNIKHQIKELETSI